MPVGNYQPTTHGSKLTIISQIERYPSIINYNMHMGAARSIVKLPDFVWPAVAPQGRQRDMKMGLLSLQNPVALHLLNQYICARARLKIRTVASLCSVPPGRAQRVTLTRALRARRARPPEAPEKPRAQRA